MVAISRAGQQIGPPNTLTLSCQGHQALDTTAASQYSQQSIASHCTCSIRLPGALSQWGMLCWCPKEEASSAECQDWGCMSWSAQEPLQSSIWMKCSRCNYPQDLSRSLRSRSIKASCSDCQTCSCTGACQHGVAMEYVELCWVP